MRAIGDTTWHKHPGRLAGVLIMAYFVLKLAAVIHLGLIGRVTEGITGRLEARNAEPGEPVVYFYRVGENSYHGWRRGLQYGGNRLSVVYSPLYAKIHVTATEPGLPSPRALWSRSDYWLRLLLAAGGLALGAVVYILWTRHQQGKFTITLLHGLTRHRDC
jgi:hypothetical protein